MALEVTSHSASGKIGIASFASLRMTTPQSTGPVPPPHPTRIVTRTVFPATTVYG
jgi:hypothetical protein